MSSQSAPADPLPSSDQDLTYAASGVDTEAGDRAVALMRDAVSATHGPAVVGGFGGFAGLFDISMVKGYERPLLASSTDGVGTKIALARALDKHDTIGIDLVAMVVDDIVVCGAKPLVMTDYIACGAVEPTRIANIVRGIATGCSQADVALVGGETAEHPGLMAPDEYDVAGAAVGVVEAADILSADRVEDGDVLIAMASTGVHSNGFSLVRRIAEKAQWSWTDTVDELSGVLGHELLTPCAIYTQPCLAVRDDVRVFSHITGGGLGANVSRVLPAGMVAEIDRSTWALPTVFSVLQQAGSVTQDAMEATFNMGIGMVAVVPADSADRVIGSLAARSVTAWVCGAVRSTQDIPQGAIQGAKGVDGGAAVCVGSYA